VCRSHFYFLLEGQAMNSGLEDKTEKIFSDSEWALIMQVVPLPPRQLQIIQHLFDGYSDKQIAAALDISVATVRTHINRLFMRLNVRDRCELILYIVRTFRKICSKIPCPLS
jgi:DNA-binding NarL/FixJ family response regulator